MKSGVVSILVLALTSSFTGDRALADSKPVPREEHDPQTHIDDSVRAGSRINPSASLRSAIDKFMQRDSTAAFNFYLGHVDSFSARPKSTVPKYAADILRAHGLPATATINESLPVVEDKKLAQDQDAHLLNRMPVHYEEDSGRSVPQPNPEENDKPDGNGKDVAKWHKRFKPPLQAEEQRALWVGPGKKQRAIESSIAKPILLAFLRQHRDVFELPGKDLETGLRGLVQTDYTVGRFARKVTFQQSLGGEPIIGGKTIVLFDHNWNVTGISRMISTPSKLHIPDSYVIDESDAKAIALGAVSQRTSTDTQSWKVAKSELGIDSIRRKRLWVVSAGVPGNLDLNMRVKLDAATGEVLNISDNVDRYSDATVRRWGYSGGNLEAPSQYVSGNFYTRDDNTLVHDFFHIVTDERGGGDPQSTCTDTGVDSLWYEEAYGTTTGSSYVRPTRRSDRDFSLWYPHNQSGSFSESNSYYWARWFFQWVKGSISDLGELPASAADYAQVLIVTNACISAGGSHSSTFEVTTDQDQGEGIPVIRLPEKCRSSNANCALSDYTGYGTFKTCEGNGCSSPPSVIHHEINHFLLKTYYDVGSGIDCSVGEQLKFLHEGILGSAVPQAYWHHYYGVGYDPADNFLYKANYDAGLVHADDPTNITLSDYYCTDEGDPYKSGRVAGQVMWEIFHGKEINGASISTMPRPATDQDFLVLTYWAAELVDASNYKDRYEMANRVMEIMENYSSLSSTGKQQWCDAWDHHQLLTFVNSAYCN